MLVSLIVLSVYKDEFDFMLIVGSQHLKCLSFLLVKMQLVSLQIKWATESSINF